MVNKQFFFSTWTQSLVITLPKKGNLQLCQNYRAISLISHPSNVMLKIILNRLQPQTEDIIAEEQTGFRAGRSTTEQIFNLRILCKKYLQHQQNLYHVFIDFKKAFDRVWHKALWATIRKYNINASIIRAIENLYDKAQNAVLFSGSTGEWFRTIVGVRQGCLLSPTIFNIFQERTMYQALDAGNQHEFKLYSKLSVVAFHGRAEINYFRKRSKKPLLHTFVSLFVPLIRNSVLS